MRAPVTNHEAREGHEELGDPLWILLLFVAFVFFPAFVFQKSICALNFAKRAVITVVGVSHGPFAMKFSL